MADITRYTAFRQIKEALGRRLSVCYVLDMNVLLRERNLDVVGVEGVIDAFNEVTDDESVLDDIDPTEQFEVERAVAELGKHHFHRPRGVYILVVKSPDGLLNHIADLLGIAAVSHAEGHCGKDIAVVTGEILIVLGEQLGVLEGYYGAVDGLNERAGIADAADFALDTVAFHPVANLYSARHQRYSIVNILEYVLRSKAYACRQAAGYDHEPCRRDIHNGQAEDYPDAPHERLDYVLTHYAAACHCLNITFVHRRMLFEQVQGYAIDVAKEEVKGYNYENSEYADADIVGVNELAGEYTPCHIAEIEYIRRPIY